MLFVPITARANFCARKFTSLVAFEQLNIPNERRRVVRREPGKTRRGGVERLVPARWAKHAILAHERLSQTTTVLTQTNHLLPSIQARGR